MNKGKGRIPPSQKLQMRGYDLIFKFILHSLSQSRSWYYTIHDSTAQLHCVCFYIYNRAEPSCEFAQDTYPLLARAWSICKVCTRLPLCHSNKTKLVDSLSRARCWESDCQLQLSRLQPHEFITKLFSVPENQDPLALLRPHGPLHALCNSGERWFLTANKII